MKKNLTAMGTTVAVLVLAWTATVTAANQRGPGRMGIDRPPIGRPMPLPPATESKKKWNESEYVFTARLDSVEAGPVARSMPPIYSHTLHFTVEKVLRGPLKPGAKVDCSHSARQNNPPVFPEGKVCLVAASKSRGRLQAKIVELATPEKLARVELSCSLPLGWKVEDGKPVSPWASMGKGAWKATAEVQSKLVCSRTGRPAFMTGSEATFAVESVPPKTAIKWTNPDGDGQYKITVTNPSDHAITVPALLSQGGKILWAESLVILSQNKVYTCPGCKPVSGKVEAAKIAAGKSVSTVVDVLRLKGPEWPRGGYRIEIQFCLGEMSQTKSLYYMSRHHDKLREAASK